MMVTAQGLLVALLVTGCCLYAAWTLMPSAARRALARALLKLPLPAPLAKRLGRTAKASAGCGCDGCDRSEVKPATGTHKPITFHPRPRR
jgi:ferrous iron transport protein B